MNSKLSVEGNGLWIHDIALEAREDSVPQFPLAGMFHHAHDSLDAAACRSLSMTVHVTNLPLGRRTTVLELRTRTGRACYGVTKSEHLGAGKSPQGMIGTVDVEFVRRTLDQLVRIGQIDQDVALGIAARTICIFLKKSERRCDRPVHPVRTSH